MRYQRLKREKAVLDRQVKLFLAFSTEVPVVFTDIASIAQFR